MISFAECPRDAMQGWPYQIATSQKINYLNALLQVGFDTLDFGSFVSPKAIPQMADTAQVLEALHWQTSATKLLAIVANERGATQAVGYDAVQCLGFPFSVSPTFQLRNTNSTLQQSLQTVSVLQELCIKNSKQLVVYLSMGFGNPYGDAYSEELVAEWVAQMALLEIEVISLADTVGLATPNQISKLLGYLLPLYPQINFGVHLHSEPQHWQAKAVAAYTAGCRRFDGAIGGIGGCPMAGNDLVGNMDTINLMAWFAQMGEVPHINMQQLAVSNQMAKTVFV
jgi:hydroxymethylglutaryl-CoA lyase